MFSRRTLAVALAVLALGQLAAANWDFAHHNASVWVFGARSVDEPKLTKSEVVKHALGKYEPTTASVVPSGCKSIYGSIQGNPEFTILEQAIDASGLKSLLDNPSLTATVFAPNDAAFVKVLAELNLDAKTLLADPVTLSQILKYHVVPGMSIAYDELVQDQLYRTMLVDSRGQIYTFRYGSDQQVAPPIGGRGRVYPDATVPKIYGKILKSDINAGCPSVAHEIDRVLLPINFFDNPAL